MKESFLLIKQQKSDNWLFTGVSPLIKFINKMEGQINNKDLLPYTVLESDCDDILSQLKQIIESKPKQLYWRIFNHFFLKKILKLLALESNNVILTIGNLLLLNSATNSLTDFNKDDIITPILAICGIVTLFLFKTISLAKTELCLNLITIRLRLIVEQLIYNKALKMQCLSYKGDSDSHLANINTLLTADLDEIMEIGFPIRDLWEQITLVIGCLAFLYHIDSHAGTVVILTMIGSTIIFQIITIAMIISEKKMLEYKDQRVALTTDVIEGIKQIKYLSWEETFSQRIMKFRKQEFLMLTLLKVFDGFSNLYWNNISYVLLCAYIIASIDQGKTLQELSIFTLIAIFNTLTFPLGLIPWCVNVVFLTSVSFKRVYKFLESPEIDNNERFQVPYINQGAVIKVDNLQFQWPLEKTEEKKTNVKNNQIVDQDDEQTLEINDENKNFLLTIDNLEIQFNTLNFIIGKIGSGKSSLFNAILNELQKIEEQQGISIQTEQKQRMPTIRDYITVKGNIGYCSQTSWVQNQSIRDNILFGKLFNEKLYYKIIDICELRKDILTFEKQDLHVIGPDGKNLSGGQRQRIALARALYQECDIYLFDDIFSSLDIHIADQIFQKVIINYLIDLGKTILLITSHYRYLQQVPAHIVKNIIYIENGKLFNNQAIINNYLQKEKQIDKENINIEEELDLVLPELEKQQSSNKEQFNNNQNNEDNDNLEEREQGKINFSTWTTYFGSMSWILLIGWIIVIFAMQGSLSLIDFWMKNELNGQDSWIHTITVYFNDSFTDTLLYLTLLALLITAVASMLYVATSLRASWVLFKKLNNILMMSVMKFYDRTNAGKIINRVQDDTNTVDDELSWTFHIFIQNIGRVSGLSIGLIILEPVFIIIVIGVAVLNYKISQQYVKANREIKRLKSANSGQILQTVNETLTGIKTIRAFEKQEHFLTVFQSQLSNWTVSDQCGQRSSLWYGVRLNLMSTVILASVALSVIFTLIFNLSDDYSIQALALTYSLVILDAFFELFIFYLRLEQGIVSVERIKQYFTNQLEYIDQKQEEMCTNQIQDQENAIVFSNIYLTYDECIEGAKYALKNFSLNVKRGQKVAFVGRTGSGKTSILNILFGLYRHQKGDIIIEGKNSKYLSLRELRQKLSVVPQFGFLYNASVKENLDPKNESKKEDIEKLFIQTGFQLRGINNSTKNECNVDFEISQNGANLSNGEKQVINFLRIVLLNKDIVCLDEATSNMDPKTDQLLHDLLFKYVENRTLLVITHRLENIQQYDKIVVMEQGEIVEQGMFKDLIQIEGGFFNKLMSHHQKDI